jgi:hypothetical protein
MVRQHGLPTAQQLIRKLLFHSESRHSNRADKRLGWKFYFLIEFRENVVSPSQ